MKSICIIGGQTKQEFKVAPNNKDYANQYPGAADLSTSNSLWIGGVNHDYSRGRYTGNNDGTYIIADDVKNLLNVHKFTFDDHTYIDWTSSSNTTSIGTTLDFMCNPPSNNKNGQSGCIYFGWQPPTYKEQPGWCMDCGGGCALKISSDQKLPNYVDIIHGEWSIATNNNNILEGKYGAQSINDLKSLYNNMMIQNIKSNVSGSYFWNFRTGCTFMWGENYINGKINEAAAWVGIKYPISIGDPLGPSCNGGWSLLQLIQMDVANPIHYYVKASTYCDSYYGGSSKQTSTFSWKTKPPPSSNAIVTNKWKEADYWSVPAPDTGEPYHCTYWGSDDIPNNTINTDCLINFKYPPSAYPSNFFLNNY